MKTLFKTGAAVLGVLVLTLFGGACKEEKKDPQAEADQVRMAEVLAIHDEVMPKMNEISGLVAELKPLADSTEWGEPYRIAMKDLQDAHQSMMDWMKGFGDRFDHSETMKGKALTPEKQEWLKEEEVKVKAMRDQVNQSLKKAKKVLEEYQASGATSDY
jgi:hypothetical protein